MSEQTTIVGKLLDETARRDAIHFALAPVVAAEGLQPGEHIGLDSEGLASIHATKIGIVDPFLTDTVLRGQRFWMFLYPNTITNLRHAWEHPAFDVEAPAPVRTLATLPPANESWRTPTVLSLARKIRESDNWQDKQATLPILGDALEEAGCPDESVLRDIRKNDGRLSDEREQRAICIILGGELEASVRWIESFAESIEQTYGKLMDSADTWVVNEGEYGGYTYDNSEVYKDHWDKFEEFWKHYEIVTGKTVECEKQCFYTCSC